MLIILVCPASGENLFHIDKMSNSRHTDSRKPEKDCDHPFEFWDALLTV